VIVEDGVLTLRGEKKSRSRTRAGAIPNAATGGSSAALAFQGDRAGQGRCHVQERRSHHHGAEVGVCRREHPSHRHQSRAGMTASARGLPAHGRSHCYRLVRDPDGQRQAGRQPGGLLCRQAVRIAAARCSSAVGFRISTSLPLTRA
jgi:hypothetical protein